MDPKKETGSADDDMDLEVITPDPSEPGIDQAISDGRREVAPQEGVEDLKRQLEDLKREKQQAENLAREHAERATAVVQDARTEQLLAYEQTAKQALDANKRALDGAKQAFKTAMESGDYDAASEAQAAIADATQNIKTATYQVNQIAAYKQQMTSQAGQTEGRSGGAQQADTASRYGVDPNSRSGRWINANSEKWERDPVFRQKALLADAQARADGIELDSDEYFERIEESTGLRERSKPEVRTPHRPQAGSTAAAPTRSGGSELRTNEPSRIRLTAAEMEAAQIAGLTPTQYAKNLLALQKEGKLTTRRAN